MGSVFDKSKHVQGTEIKAITYSNMQIHNPIIPELQKQLQDEGKRGANFPVHLFVIVDI